MAMDLQQAQVPWIHSFVVCEFFHSIKLFILSVNR